MDEPTYRDVSGEHKNLINNTPVLMSLLYDLDLLPEQFATFARHGVDQQEYARMYERLMGVLICYQYMEAIKRK